jgi:acyl-CoA synthetase (AMP-forming)/AMP-acid ligase II
MNPPMMNLPKYVPPATTVRALIAQHARTQPDAVFAMFPETQAELSYKALEQEVQQYAAQFYALGLAQGDTVSYMMGNGRSALVLFLSALYAGLIVSPLNPAAGPEQITYVLQHSDTKLVFVSPNFKAVVDQAQSASAIAIPTVECDEDCGPVWPQASVSAIKLVPIEPTSDGLLMYTSGTTGRPKGVVLTHENLLAGGMNTAVAHELTSTDRALCVLPLCHINAQCVTVMAPLVSGGSLVLPHGFSATRFWHWVTESQCSWFSVVPTIISYLMHQPMDGQKELIESAPVKVRFGRSASAALPPALHAGFEEKFSVPIVETMGLTETAAQILSNPMPPKANKYGSPGVAFGTYIKIADEAGNEVAHGVEGELLVQGKCVMRCYYKNPQATAATIDDQGWLRTGDLAIIDKDGFCFITGRIKELIIKGGENIAPREIDDVLYTHPAVIEAAAIGIDDVHYGQEVVACVVLAEGKQASEVDIINFCQSKLGKVKTPKQIHFFHDLPKGPSGKVQRLKLVDQVQA